MRTVYLIEIVAFTGINHNFNAVLDLITKNLSNFVFY